MVAHLSGAGAQEVFPKLMEISDVTRFDFHGDPSPQAAEIRAGFGAQFFGSWAGFNR